MANKPQLGHDIITTTFIELVAVGLFAIFAGMNDDAGKMLLVIMWGLVLLWLLTHTNQLANMVKSL